VSEAWHPDKRLRAGERGGAKVDGFDLGNSPLDCTPDVVKGKRLFLTTTNGTRALQRVEKSPIVITTAQINCQAAVRYLQQQKPETIWMVGSGWEGSFSLEDTACAGAIAKSLLASGEAIIGNDEVIAAIALYSQWQEQLVEMFRQSSHGQRLLRLDCEEDLAYCAAKDTVDVLPIQKEPGVLVKFSPWAK
ncbi:MAG: 2-phosphosulfolactate phosphatase, partial [Moorea sp. SIO2B7]|nr:2-phosphosulfolactate phosphatase [Moorena sp. SIO2B7]